MGKPNVPEVEIRSYRAEDAPGLIALAAELAEALQEPRPALTAEQVAAACDPADPWCEILVADEAGSLLGFAVICRRFEPHMARRTLWLADLHVTAAARRRGLGRRLLAAVGARALAQGCSLVVWDLWALNERARAFYRDRGAERDDELQVYRVDPSQLI